MAENAIKKVVNFFLGDTEDVEEYDQMDGEVEYDNAYEEVEEEENRTFNPFKSRSKVVAMPQPAKIQMEIKKPTNFEQAEEIIQLLKQKNAIVLNLEYVSKDVARRIIDLVSGAVQALDGDLQKVSNSIFVVAPYNYDIVNDATKEKIENKLSASWIK